MLVRLVFHLSENPISSSKTMVFRQTRFASDRCACSFTTLGSLFLIACALTSCGPDTTPTSESAAPADKPGIYVVSHPLAFLAQRIGGELVHVVFPIPRGMDPATWEPDDETIAAYQTADLILLNGADYAKWTLRSSLPLSRTIVTTRDVSDRLIEVPDAVTHSHGSEGAHAHEELCSETWLDPELAIAQARVIKQEIEVLLPGSAAALQRNLQALITELRGLDKELKSAFTLTSLPWMASGSAFSYLGRRYSLDLQLAHWHGDEYPSEEQWNKLEAELAGQPASWMLWQVEPIRKTSDRLQELGVGVVVFETGALPPSSGDYLTVMRRNLDRLKAAIASQGLPS